MDRQMEELLHITEMFDKKTPLFIAGDIFHKWNSSPELINWALRWFSKFWQVYAVPGNHDLPLHNYDDIAKSAFWTLVEAEVVKLLDNENPIYFENSNTAVFGVAHGKTLESSAGSNPGHSGHPFKSVAVVHHYIWSEKIPKSSFPGAPQEDRADKWLERLDILGYTHAFFGDNHYGFGDHSQSVSLVNCGGFMRRRTDERLYEPQVALLYTDGRVLLLPLKSCQTDKVEYVSSQQEERNSDAKEVLNALSNLGDAALDFQAVCNQVMKTRKVSKSVRDIILQAMETSN